MVTERDTIYCKSEIYSPVEQKKNCTLLAGTKCPSLINETGKQTLCKKLCLQRRVDVNRYKNKLKQKTLSWNKQPIEQSCDV